MKWWLERIGAVLVGYTLGRRLGRWAYHRAMEST